MTADRAAAGLLTTLDAQVLGLLHAHRVLTTAQVVQAVGIPSRTVEYRLNRLRRLGLVSRTRPYRDRGSAPFHWWLTRHGQGAACSTEPSRARELADPNPYFLGHTVAVASVALALEEAGPRVGVMLDCWAREATAWEDWQADHKKWRIAPDARLDATITATDGEWRSTAFIEVDLGTMTHRRLRDKLLRYLRYAADRRWEDRHPACPPLLLLTTSEDRARRFMEGVALLRRRHSKASGISWTAAEHAKDLAVFACGLVREPEGAITDPAWLIEDGAATIALTDALAGVPRAKAARDLEAAAAERAWRERTEAERQAALVRRFVDIAVAGRSPYSDPEAVMKAVRWREAADALAWLLSKASWRSPDVRHPLLVQAAEWWFEDAGSDGERPGALAPRLAHLHTRVWREQAETVMEAAGGSRDTPRLRAAAAKLARGSLLTDADLARLGEDQWDDRAACAEYGRRRQAAIDRARKEAPLWRRRAVDDSFGFEYDDEHVKACQDCGAAVPDDAQAHWKKGECPGCGGPLAAWRDREPVGSLASFIESLRTARWGAEGAREADAWSIRGP